MPVSERWIGRVHHAESGRRALSNSRLSPEWNGRFHDGRPLLRSKLMVNLKSQDRGAVARKIKRVATSTARRVSTVRAILNSAVLLALTQAHRLRLYLLQLSWHSMQILLSIVLVDDIQMYSVHFRVVCKRKSFVRPTLRYHTWASLQGLCTCILRCLL